MTAPDPTAGQHTLLPYAKCSCGAEHDRRGTGESGYDWFARHTAENVAASTGTSEDVETLAKVLDEHQGCVANDSRSREWIDGSGVTGIDVWTCGIEVPYVDDLDEMARLHLAAALAPVLDASRRATAEEIAAAIEKRRLARRRRWLRSHRWSARDESVWSQAMWDAARIAWKRARR